MSQEIATAADVKAALTRRWPDTRYLHVYEAPTDPARQGRKIDVLVVSLWQSDRYELDAVEVKVSYSDWRKEISTTEWFAKFSTEDGREHRRGPYHFKPKIDGHSYDMWDRETRRWLRPVGEVELERLERIDTSKSIDWRNRAHRFWIACPEKLAAKVLADIPIGWGLIACTAEGTRTIKKPTVNKYATRLTWPQMVGVLRAAADSGFQALNRAEARGFRNGQEHERQRRQKQEAA